MLAPLVAACGVLVAKMSGRGLGHTGGTLDKLESIPGMRVSLSLAGMRRQVEQVGVAVCGQTPELAPADGRLYALRDVTATVASMPLIATSIMSKKMAAGAVAAGARRQGRGGRAACRTRMPRASWPALMVRLGRGHGIDTRALLSNMDEPLGAAVGNALEVAEAVDTLRGQRAGRHHASCACIEAAVLAGDRRWSPCA